MKEKSLGVVEAFFGPTWSWEDRGIFCQTLAAQGGDFYIYAPKRDSYLRRDWSEKHPAETWRLLKKLSELCRQLNIEFGVGLTPFEVHSHWDEKTRGQLREKILQLQELGGETLGLFFDDMKGAPDLAAKQAEMVEFARSLTRQKIIFCPTYYTTDPILDKVFGERPKNYLEELGQNLHPDVDIFWTGSKVIPMAISGGELKEVATILKRAPVIWDNFFANDGPKQCQFLKLKALSGRGPEAFSQAKAWAMNLTNQASLSEILFAASELVLKSGEDPEAAFQAALKNLAGPEMADLIKTYQTWFNEQGLDRTEEKIKDELRKKLDPKNRFAKEILAWLDRQYIVGPECLTE
jgi:hypothetical protein